MTCESVGLMIRQNWIWVVFVACLGMLSLSFFLWSALDADPYFQVEKGQGYVQIQTTHGLYTIIDDGDRLRIEADARKAFIMPVDENTVVIGIGVAE